ncbi:zinc finger RNA-binding protein [Dermacentor silvarum]|uniref:zinc finger RNA-binding protein n=1 Tax=Dermacentor silvarum TaxID=543639 RepID=UPI00189B92CD|nr:zinc finger RNA-binding protein [Dermacentor silvarum]
MASTHFACKECSMHFSGPMPYMDHLKSARHQKKVAAHRQMEALIGAGAEVRSPDIKLEVTSAATGLPSMQIAPLRFVCELCDVAMNCEDALISHKKGKKHQRVLQREEVLRQLAAGRDACQKLPAESTMRRSSTSPTSTAPEGTASSADDAGEQRRGGRSCLAASAASSSSRTSATSWSIWRPMRIARKGCKPSEDETIPTSARSGPLVDLRIRLTASNDDVWLSLETTTAALSAAIFRF